jgi:hypothetical protein
MWEILNLAFSIVSVTIVLWAIYLPLAWLGEERFFFNLMRKESKGRQYWLEFFPTFLKRELKAAFAFFIILMVIAIVESVMKSG